MASRLVVGCGQCSVLAMMRCAPPPDLPAQPQAHSVSNISISPLAPRHCQISGMPGALYQIYRSLISIRHPSLPHTLSPRSYHWRYCQRRPRSDGHKQAWSASRCDKVSAYHTPEAARHSTRVSPSEYIILVTSYWPHHIGHIILATSLDDHTSSGWHHHCGLIQCAARHVCVPPSRPHARVCLCACVSV